MPKMQPVPSHEGLPPATVCESLSDLPTWIRTRDDLLAVACDYAVFSAFPIAVSHDGSTAVLVPLSHLRDFSSPEDLNLAVYEWVISPRDRKDRLQ